MLTLGIGELYRHYELATVAVGTCRSGLTPQAIGPLSARQGQFFIRKGCAPATLAARLSIRAVYLDQRISSEDETMNTLTTSIGCEGQGDMEVSPHRAYFWYLDCERKTLIDAQDYSEDELREEISRRKASGEDAEEHGAVLNTLVSLNHSIRASRQSWC